MTSVSRILGCLRPSRLLCCAFALAAAQGCSAGRDENLPGTPVNPVGPGGRLPDPQATSREELRAELARDRPATADEFLSRWTPAQLAKLSYDPRKAQGLALLQRSHIALNDRELEVLGNEGLVISGRQQFPTFFYGYKSIYADDLPLYVSADSIMFAVHRSYDKILLGLERAALQPALEALLTGMQQRLSQAATAGHGAQAMADVDEYLAVALRLLGKPGPLVAGGREVQVKIVVEQATTATGTADLTLFGLERTIDFSQFKPRGHYLGDLGLESYFRAMMWLGRVDTAMPLVTTTNGGQTHFLRRSFAAALLLADLARPDEARWKAIDSTLRGFVGESDNMVVTDFEALRMAAGATGAADLLAKTDEQLAQLISSGSFGIQRIASQILYVPPTGANKPLDRTFQLFGQRYVIDAEVLSNVVFDRVLPAGGEKRMMPTPLDVAFAALGNDAAAPLLRDELGRFENYPAALQDARRLVDLHEPAFWQGSLYGGWMAALRALSPPHDGTDAAKIGLPAIAGTEAWGRRVLNAQLASWAELRHDTLLYAKQSYTGYPVCEFPDAYVEPQVAFWDALVGFAARGKALAAVLPPGAQDSAPAIQTYFQRLEQIMQRLKEMAERQRSGQPFTAEQMAFINQAVELKDVSVGCATIQSPVGWYPELFFDKDDSMKQDPTIADVHTQPADADGNPVGYVLHVATGYARLMVVTFETCRGPRAYVGLASSYFERITKDYRRLDDMTWSTELKQAVPTDVPWLSGILRR
jgi:hypothetical protein